MTETVTRFRCREEGELVGVRCIATCGCLGREYPAGTWTPPAEEGAGRAGKSAAGNGTPPNERSQ